MQSLPFACSFSWHQQTRRLQRKVMDQSEIVVVTGSSGFLAYHVLRLLISRDKRVREIRCLDRDEPEAHMKQLLDDENNRSTSECEQSGELVRPKIIKWIKGDIRDINIVEKTLAHADCVIHCAALVGIWTESEDQDQDEFESVNVGGTENLLKTAIRLGVAKFIHVSSFEVYTGYGTIYYATESTLPETDWLLFGPSAKTKKFAELKVKQYSSSKLAKPSRDGADSLNAVIVRFPCIYGEFDKTYVSKILEMAKFFNGKLRRIDNTWIVQQPIYAGNAAWSLIKAKHRMDRDLSISGEEFHVTDDTTMGDPYDFLSPYLECKGMHVTKTSYPYLPLMVFLLLLSLLRRTLRRLDFLGLFVTRKKGRLDEAIEQDRAKSKPESDSKVLQLKAKQKRWYDYWNTASISFMSITSFLNRTKASLRLDYEPIFDAEESQHRSINWYRDCLEL